LPSKTSSRLSDTSVLGQAVKSLCSGLLNLILATWEADIGRTMV
jgi:hypothetical protein